MFNKEEFIKAFDGALSILPLAESEGIKAAQLGFDRLVFVACGAPHQMMRSIQFWTDKYAASTDVRVLHAGEFVHQNPAFLDERTIVFLGSHSGTTREVIDAANYLKEKACRTFAVTQQADSELGKIVDLTFNYGPSVQGYFCSVMLAMAFTSAFLKEREKVWDFHKNLMCSLSSFPSVLADAKRDEQEKGDSVAIALKDSEAVYFIGSGPSYTTAYIFAACFLMEMQWMHAFPLSAAEFFHGPFEVLNKDTPVVLLLAEDDSQPEAERVLNFCQKYLSEPIVYDSRDFTMKGIHESVRPMLAPFILDSAMTNFVERLADLNQHPLTTRRYMGKVEY
ncbi:MAG: SIS domain-containing protein [Chloroflexi bacterium]|nr:SIS domain-containing protein [Chloroflexota bacterium]